MKQVMNEVTYEKRAKGGMRLTMLKYLSASPTEEGDNHAD